MIEWLIFGVLCIICFFIIKLNDNFIKFGEFISLEVRQIKNNVDKTDTNKK